MDKTLEDYVTLDLFEERLQAMEQQIRFMREIVATDGVKHLEKDVFDMLNQAVTDLQGIQFIVGGG